jgi:hypothetical protein
MAYIGTKLNDVYSINGIVKGNGGANPSAATGAEILSPITGGQILAAIGSATGGTTQSSLDNSTKLATTEYVDNLRNVAANAQTAQYTIALTDRGNSIDITTGGVLIPTNASVAFPVGAVVAVYNNSGSAQDIAAVTPGTTTVRKAGTATTGTLSLAQYGVATMRKVATDVWVVSGTLA